MSRARQAWTEFVTGQKQKSHKFHAQKTAGYDSKLEAGIAQEIGFMRRAGELCDVIEQAPFPLYGAGGTKICVHRVDFLLVFQDGHPEIWEAKGLPTPVWKLKYRLFQDNYPSLPYQIRKRATR